ncbi:MAG: sulfurtransferase complex subunit TusD [Pseudomonadaceae bacterium]|nr:sulfurtransferase complex subunit TusD [Pseudomonadaceae bacterium]
MARFAIAVHGGPYESQAPISALRFATTAMSAGHEIARVFFYHDGVLNALMRETLQDEANPTSLWQKFASDTGVELTVCIAAALKRGIFDEREAKRYGTQISMADGFVLAGVGQMVDAAITSDRTITFLP